MKADQRLKALEQRIQEQDQKIADLSRQLSQTATGQASLPFAQQSDLSEYLLSKGWIPTENGQWELPAKPQEVSKVMVKVPNIRPGKPETEFERTVVQTMPLPCSLVQAVYRQRALDEKQKVA